MNKIWVSVIILLLILGTSVTLYKGGMKKIFDGSHTTESTENSDGQSSSNQIVSYDENGKPVYGQSNSGTSSIEGSGSAGSASSTPGNGVSGSKQGSGVAEVKKVENNCFAFEYRHTKDAQNKDIEDFLDYSNAFAFTHDDVNAKSVCVKVNGKPVAFKMNKFKSQNEVMVGSVVGPESVIRVSYCVGKVTCKEACAVKSNRFMDDMMSDAGDDDEFKDSWGNSDSTEHAAKKKELKGKVKELRSIASENKDLSQRSVIRTWETLQKNEWVCKK